MSYSKNPISEELLFLIREGKPVQALSRQEHATEQEGCFPFRGRLYARTPNRERPQNLYALVARHRRATSPYAQGIPFLGAAGFIDKRLGDIKQCR
jgi:hypothetical protein